MMEALKQIPVFGPSKWAHNWKEVKHFSKAFMLRHSIPTASYAEFTAVNIQDGLAYIAKHTTPVVLKSRWIGSR